MQAQESCLSMADRTSSLALERAFKNLLPVGAHLLVTSATFGAALLASQAAGLCLRVSCATPVFGSCCGLMGVAVASSCAGIAGKLTTQFLETSRNPFTKDWYKKIDMGEVVVDAVFGVACFKILGGSFRQLMPSDLQCPGALAMGSLPARSAEYADHVYKYELERLFRQYGCHHCGSKRGNAIGDHIPPNKLVYGGKSGSVKKRLSVDQVAKRLSKVLRIPQPPTKQRFYAQCQRCSLKQSGAMRSDRRVLVMHFGGFRPQYVTGFLVGQLHYLPPSDCGRPGGFDAERRLKALGLPWPLPGWAWSQKLAAKVDGDEVVQQEAAPLPPSQSLMDYEEPLHLGLEVEPTLLGAVE